MPGAAVCKLNALTAGLAVRVLPIPGAQQGKVSSDAHEPASWGGPLSDGCAAMRRALGAGAGTWGRGHQRDLARGSELAQTSRGALPSKMGFHGDQCYLPPCGPKPNCLGHRMRGGRPGFH